MERVKFTTTFEKELLRNLKIESVNLSTTVNVLLEKITDCYFADKECLREIPNNLKGVYFFYDDNDELLYIGVSKDLRKRMLCHFSDRGHLGEKIKSVSKIQLFPICDEADSHTIEKELIQALHPELNNIRNFNNKIIEIDRKTKQQTNSRQLITRLDEELIKQVKRICIEKGMTFQGAVKISIEEWIKNQR